MAIDIAAVAGLLYVENEEHVTRNQLVAYWLKVAR